MPTQSLWDGLPSIPENENIKLCVCGCNRNVSKATFYRHIRGEQPGGRGEDAGVNVNALLPTVSEQPLSSPAPLDFGDSSQESLSVGDRHFDQEEVANQQRGRQPAIHPRRCRCQQCLEYSLDVEAAQLPHIDNLYNSDVEYDDLSSVPDDDAVSGSSSSGADGGTSDGADGGSGGGADGGSGGGADGGSGGGADGGSGSDANGGSGSGADGGRGGVRRVS